MVAIAMILAAVAWSGRSVFPTAIGFVALYNPVPALVVAAGWVIHHRYGAGTDPTPDDEARFLAGIVSEARGGASPRQAIVRVAEREQSIKAGVAVRAATLGLDSAVLSRALTQALPLNGRLAGAAWAISNEVGAPFAPVMGLLADRASSRGRLQRDQRGLTAQARATAWIVGGIPLALVALLATTGRISVGHSLSIAALGMGLQLLGVGLVVAMLRRSA
jgi:Flp pilus assembly protein TadB